MVILSEFRMRQYRDDDYLEDALDFNSYLNPPDYQRSIFSTRISFFNPETQFEFDFGFIVLYSARTDNNFIKNPNFHRK